MPVRISKRTQLTFAEFATGYATVNVIARAFQAEGFEAGPEPADAGGARRATCASFHNRIDALSDPQQRRLLSVYLDALAEWAGDWGRKEDEPLGGGALDVIRSLRRDGIPVDDLGRLTEPLPPSDMGLSELRRLRDPGVLEEHLERMRANLDRDTPAVIGAAKELVESVCKVILDDCAVAYAPSASLPGLYKAVAQELGLSRGSVPATAPGADAAQRVLQGLMTAVQNLAEMRNALGSGHGRAQRVSALERHARLAMNASHTLADFLLATWHERRGASDG